MTKEMNSEKFSLKWNDYQSNWNQSLSGLRNDTDMSDVTLITDDKVKMSAHKILLSSCSNVFKFILKESKQANPLIYLSGINSVNLGFILDYIHYGEVNLYQEQLDEFLESAQKLEIVGLLGEHHDNQQEQPNVFEENLTPINSYKEEEHKNSAEAPFVSINTKATMPRIHSKRLIANKGSKFDVTDMTPEEIREKINSMYQKIDGIWTCNECGQTSNKNIRLHVETHLEGLSYPCNLCQQEFRSKNSLYCHTMIKHKN